MYKHVRNMSSHSTLITFIVFCISSPLLPGRAKELDCIKIDDCSCKFNDKDGKVVTLKPLGNKDGTPLFLDQQAKDGYLYSYNPCYTFDEDDCSKSAVCQRETKNGTTTSIVGQQNVQFGYDTHNVQVTYLSTDGLPRKVVVSYVCLENQSPPTFEAFGYDNITQQYLFQVGSECACGNGCYSPSDDDGGLSAGSVLLILCVVMLFLYIVLGTIHGKVVRGASGLKMLPNYEFWAGLPGDIKKGCLYTARCTCCRPKPKTYDDL